MPRYKADAPTMFIDNSRYRGDDRRTTKRVKALIPATLHAAGAEEIVKIVDISEGGCAWVGHLLVNVQATVSLQFYNQTEEGYVSCQPIHGRVVHVFLFVSSTVVIHFSGQNFIIIHHPHNMAVQ